MNKTNVQIFDETDTLYDFWQRGGTWSMDQYCRYLIKWEANQKEIVS